MCIEREPIALPAWSPFTKRPCSSMVYAFIKLSVCTHCDRPVNHTAEFVGGEGRSKVTRLQIRSNLFIQVAQLWQRDRAKLDSFSINVQRYSLKSCTKLDFWAWGIMGNALYLKFLTQKHCSRVSSRECQFYS